MHRLRAILNYNESSLSLFKFRDCRISTISHIDDKKLDLKSFLGIKIKSVDKSDFLRYHLNYHSGCRENKTEFLLCSLNDILKPCITYNNTNSNNALGIGLHPDVSILLKKRNTKKKIISSDFVRTNNYANDDLFFEISGNLINKPKLVVNMRDKNNIIKNSSDCTFSSMKQKAQKRKLMLPAGSIIAVIPTCNTFDLKSIYENTTNGNDTTAIPEPTEAAEYLINNENTIKNINTISNYHLLSKSLKKRGQFWRNLFHESLFFLNKYLIDNKILSKNNVNRIIDATPWLEEILLSSYISLEVCKTFNKSHKPDFIADPSASNFFRENSYFGVGYWWNYILETENETIYFKELIENNGFKTNYISIPRDFLGFYNSKDHFYEKTSILLTFNDLIGAKNELKAAEAAATVFQIRHKMNMNSSLSQSLSPPLSILLSAIKYVQSSICWIDENYDYSGKYSTDCEDESIAKDLSSDDYSLVPIKRQRQQQQTPHIIPIIDLVLGNVAILKDSNFSKNNNSLETYINFESNPALTKVSELRQNFKFPKPNLTLERALTKDLLPVLLQTWHCKNQENPLKDECNEYHKLQSETKNEFVNPFDRFIIFNKLNYLKLSKKISQEREKKGKNSKRKHPRFTPVPQVSAITVELRSGILHIPKLLFLSHKHNLGMFSRTSINRNGYDNLVNFNNNNNKTNSTSSIEGDGINNNNSSIGSNTRRFRSAALLTRRSHISCHGIFYSSNLNRNSLNGFGNTITGVDGSIKSFDSSIFYNFNSYSSVINRLLLYLMLARRPWTHRCGRISRRAIKLDNKSHDIDVKKINNIKIDNKKEEKIIFRRGRSSRNYILNPVVCSKGDIIEYKFDSSGGNYLNYCKFVNPIKGCWQRLRNFYNASTSTYSLMAAESASKFYHHYYYFYYHQYLKHYTEGERKFIEGEKKEKEKELFNLKFTSSLSPQNQLKRRNSLDDKPSHNYSSLGIEMKDSRDNTREGVYFDKGKINSINNRNCNGDVKDEDCYYVLYANRDVYDGEVLWLDAPMGLLEADQLHSRCSINEILTFSDENIQSKTGAAIGINKSCNGGSTVNNNVSFISNKTEKELEKSVLEVIDNNNNNSEGQIKPSNVESKSVGVDDKTKNKDSSCINSNVSNSFKTYFLVMPPLSPSNLRDNDIIKEKEDKAESDNFILYRKNFKYEAKDKVAALVRSGLSLK